MNKKKTIIIILTILLLLGLSAFIYFNKNDSETNLNVSETTWIEENKNNVLDISIFADIPTLSYNGQGIIFDFLDSLEADTGLTFNRISYEIGSTTKSEYLFTIKDTVESNDIVILKDNYVLVSKENIKFVSLDEIKDQKIGTLINDLERVNKYIKKNTNSYTTYDNIKTLFDSLYTNEVNLIAVPKTQYLEKILSNNYYISYNISELNQYYTLSLGNDPKLNTILKKYYSKWEKDNYKESYNINLINEYFTFLNIEEQYKSKFRSKEYKYGFINNGPFDLIVDNNLVGINSNILSEFVNATNIKIQFIEYNSYQELINAFNKGEIDFYFNCYQTETYNQEVLSSASVFDERYVIVSKYNNINTINSIYSLEDKKISSITGTKFNEYLINNGINVKEYKNISKLLNSNSDYYILDYLTYDYYKNSKLKNYKVDYIGNLESDYNYIVRGIKDNTTFNNVLSFYLSYELSNNIINQGLYQAISVNYLPIILTKVLKILGIILGLTLIVLLIVMLRPKNIRKYRNTLTKKEKLKYLDDLTSLKNRNFLNDNMEKWDKCNVYPQAIIIIDLNNIAYINDNYGHNEGDNTINEAANVLIKNQLPKSEIIRTNGNEFLLYLVSYNEKQIITYIRKLNKELKDISHNFGAAIGYSIINDEIKTIDDAINEATIDMKNNKEEIKN